MGEYLDALVLPAEARARSLVDRRVAGEPLQYVLGSWSFHGLDLMVDSRVLIPRFETEVVVDVALEEAARLGLRRRQRTVAVSDPSTVATVVDAGTGSGAIALALEAELPDVEVWATDVSEDALTVARANVASGMPGTLCLLNGGQEPAAHLVPVVGRHVREIEGAVQGSRFPHLVEAGDGTLNLPDIVGH